MRINIFSAIILAAAQACAAANAADLSVAFIPATEPMEFTAQTRTAAQFIFPIASLGAASESKKASAALTSLMTSRKPRYASLLNELVLSSLKEQGFSTTTLAAVPRTDAQPTSIDYAKVSFEQTVAFQVHIEEIGFYSGMAQSKWIPKLNVWGIAFTAGGKKYPYEATIAYGADSKPGNDWAIEATASSHFNDFEEILANPDRADFTFRTAIPIIADKLARQLKASLLAR